LTDAASSSQLAAEVKAPKGSFFASLLRRKKVNCAALAPSNSSAVHARRNKEIPDSGLHELRGTICRTFAFALTQTAAGARSACSIRPVGPVPSPGDASTTGHFSRHNALDCHHDQAGATDSVHLRGLTIEGLAWQCSLRPIENCHPKFREPSISSHRALSVSNTIASKSCRDPACDPGVGGIT
jgi:hypothetical protein